MSGAAPNSAGTNSLGDAFKQQHRRHEDREDAVDGEEIPAFQTIAPSIFAAARVDLTKPPPELPSELHKARETVLGDIDEHTKAIQDNIYWMLNREKTRIRQECWQREARLAARGLTRGAAPGLTEDEQRRWIPDNGMELDDIFFIRSYCPEPPRGGPYEVAPGFSHTSCLHVETGWRFRESPRKSAEKMMLNLVKHGVQNLEGLDQHVKDVKEARILELEGELRAKGDLRARSEEGEILDSPGDRMELS
ncbi:hypothetical protein GGS23DRAFT_501831 [Durotheca rogersii]|uniref:uncharacterized protein n=1 Tax=Durotheca rogersii TaxID=419775 RepID=UPI00221F4BCE|nr:uncharacterized protein GGS23DRAFT_501831 [Durotheca rogersii]KAI5854075.1 hypothetical protein GGS23DRAFT_501831 [Durotheca rogersii]